MNAHYMAITFSINQKHPEVLYRFQRLSGLGVINGPYTYDGYTHYSYRVTGYERVLWMAKILWPYLGIQKRRQANEMLRKFRAGPLTS